MPSVAVASIGKKSGNKADDENGSSIGGGRSANFRTVDTQGALSVNANTTDNDLTSMSFDRRQKDFDSSSQFLPTNMSVKSNQARKTR